jgi:hypothetical protein
MYVPADSFVNANIRKADFCDAQLPLFLAIMERSKNPVIRSNAVIALGDMVFPEMSFLIFRLSVSTG